MTIFSEIFVKIHLLTRLEKVRTPPMTGQHLGVYKIENYKVQVGNRTPVKLECVVGISGIGWRGFRPFSLVQRVTYTLKMKFKF